jgi:hypothetical protein
MAGPARGPEFHLVGAFVDDGACYFYYGLLGVPQAFDDVVHVDVDHVGGDELGGVYLGLVL